VISEPAAAKTLLIGIGIDRCCRFMEQGSVPSIPLNSLLRRRRQQRKSQIRTVAGFAEVIEVDETSGAAACNHPNCLVLPLRLELIRHAA
jgi:hypothetical protein